MEFCRHTKLIDLADSCVRELWAAFVPSCLVFVFLAALLPLPAPVQYILRTLKQPFIDFLPLSEALGLDQDGDATKEPSKPLVPVWRTVVFSALTLVETLAWLGVGVQQAVAHTGSIAFPFLVAFTWLYAAMRSVTQPAMTPPYELSTLFLTHLASTVLVVCGSLYDSQVLGLPLPNTFTIIAEIANLLVILALLSLVLSMPLAIPDRHVKTDSVGDTISPEDYTTLFDWITFRWISPLIARGSQKTLNETDIWDLSPTMQARPLYMKFSATHRDTLLRRLWAANSCDLLMDFGLTYVSVIFNYLGPFFLKGILDSLDARDRASLTRAYIYTVLALLSTLCKVQADLQHLWYAKRATTRIKSELMVAIYDKALKRKDLSGIVDHEKIKTAKTNQSDAENSGPKADADVGKIVNLMSVDANKCAIIVSGLFFLYGAPFEIIIACVFLYQLLGWSAFAGLLVLLVGWPLNNYAAKCAVRIQKGVSNARDKRMGVINELISAVKFIKLFAWEDRWVQRVLDAREAEMKWMVKSRINTIMFSLIWSCAPILVSLTAFFVYVMQGNQLTVGTAFTAIALFSMLRNPLNVIPSWVVQVLQAGVSLNRISAYLNEDEVNEQVSTLKKATPPADEEMVDVLGLDHATLRWNEIEKISDQDKKTNEEPLAATTVASNEGDSASSTAVDDVSEADTVEAAAKRRFELTDTSVMFPESKLTVITGPTGSGKTALLMALLGEMTLLSGRLIMSKNPCKVDARGLQYSISYAAQTPWLRHQSIRDNILFGYPFDEKRYREVVECCALVPDLENLEDGDMTEIGARGISLSGGQKARVALARAVYAPTRYVLLDDPLSAVDSHTAHILFDKLLCGPLLTHRTVILVTHHVELVLPGTYYIVRMLDGRIDSQGTIQELYKRCVFEDIVQDNTPQEAQVVKAAEETADEVEDSEPLTSAKKPRKLVEDEKRETGGVKWNVYRTYLEASSYWTWAILSFLIVFNQLLAVSEKFWIKVWGEAYAESSNTTGLHIIHDASSEPELQHSFLSSYPMIQIFGIPGSLRAPIVGKWPAAQEHPLFYIGVYALISLGGAFIMTATTIVLYTGALRASRVLFQQLLVKVTRATMRWHDVTPQGRMLNRFSKDIETIDSSLWGSIRQVNTSMASFIVSAVTIIAIFPLFMIPASLIGYIYYKLAVGYINIGRDLRRMDSNTRSPIFSSFGELLEGVVTVRAFSAEQRFLDNHTEKMDLTNKMYYMFWMANRWLLLRFDALGALVIFITTLFALSGYVDAGLAGVCITSAMTFTSSVYWVCRLWTGLELDLNAVERVVEYLNLPQEPATFIASSRIPAYWPSCASSNGNALVSIESLSVKYAPELPTVLRNVTLEIKVRERVGLLGRTGSGKSTLAMSLLRFVEPASGRIIIDGIDISQIGLHDLRSHITFIPQDPALFSGTLRDNLDPFNEYEDRECMDVLYRVHLVTELETEQANPVRAIGHEDDITFLSNVIQPEDNSVIALESLVSPGGSNFSAGQRQLIAMARALLRRSPIIILDEATSSIDFATDAKIQATIREEFSDSALLTVAHRLHTVIDYDRLVVLDKGEIVENDTPWNLIQKQGGLFRNLCMKSGAFDDLQAAAKAARVTRRA